MSEILSHARLENVITNNQFITATLPYRSVSANSRAPPTFFMLINFSFVQD